MSNILCIDDEPSVGVVLEHHLSEIGHQPTLATSVDEGLRAVRDGDFELIISDYRMPNATGLDLLEMLRQQGYDIPVMHLSQLYGLALGVPKEKLGLEAQEIPAKL